MGDGECNERCSLQDKTRSNKLTFRHMLCTSISQAVSQRTNQKLVRATPTSRWYDL